ncbi:MAG: hypothetical protein GY757_47010, partial [bacterium]|nr:hypothetical protein [bacterium]
METEKPQVLGISAYKCTIPASLFVFKKTREKHPHIKTLLGGGMFSDTHAVGSPSFDALLEYSEKFVDKIFVGQGENLFLSYLEGELPEEKRVYTLKDIDKKLLPFEETDIPDFSDLDLSKYPYLVGTSSASCQYKCSFCNARKFWGEYRTKAPKQVVREMHTLYRKYGHQLFFMTDSLLNPVITDLANEFINRDISLYY